jgi:endonuclease/exonuclease/phosphatase family metal-dependent hydrolase
MIIDEQRQEMNTMTNPQSFRISRTAKLTLATTTLLLAVVALFLLAAPQRPAEAIGYPGTQSLAPTLSVSKSSVVVDEGRTATNTGGYGDLVDLDADTVRVSASVGTVTQGSTVTGTWYWSYATPHVPATETKTVTITATDSTGRSSTKSFSLTIVDHGLVQPKVMAYNIFEGKVDLPAVASTIRALNPDIVLLNEVRKYDAYTSFFPPPNGVSDQTKWLADQSGFPYYKYHRTAYTGLTGSKGVAILSQYPISSTDFVELPDENDFLPQWGILKATIEIDGLTHDVFSTRFPPAQRAPGEPGYDPTDRPENEAYHKQAIGIVRSIPSDHAVIFGGDLNASWIGSPWAKEFHDNSGLTDVFVEKPDPDPFGGTVAEDRADYIYYRGPYSVSQTQNRNSESLGLPAASDHPYVFAHFLRDY